VRVVNWGSWQSRLVPDGFSFARAFEQLEQFGHIVADIAGRYVITIAIEPICPGECNIVYYVRDALHLARVIGRPEVRVLADYYHMVKQSEPMEHLVEAGAWVRHAHTSDDGRRFPTEDGFDQALFFRYLRRAGYDERVSLECRAAEGYEEKARAASAYLRGVWEDTKAGPES
jgi:sugar phosphate isomerase/epimerase